MPRLTPRRSRHRFEELEQPLFSRTELSGHTFSQAESMENASSCSVPALSPHAPKLQLQNLKLYQRRVLSDKAAACNNAPLSPCPTSSSEPLMENIKSPLPNDIVVSDASFSSDFSITPPVTGHQLLMVSAKRLGQDVRREHSKRRRPSRRVAGDSNDLNLWNTTPSQESSEDEDEDLLFLFPQPKISPGEQTKHYWEWCYGKGHTIELKPESWSAKRVPPAKGCLFHAKEESTPTAHYNTPPASRLERQVRSSKQKKQVQFGLPQAAEYEIDEPPQSLTPLPSHVTRARYSMDQKEETQVEEELTHETKQNSALLEEWEEDFAEPRSSSRRKRNNRRSSSLFTPSPMLDDDKSARENVSLTAPSPSVEVMTNLASMRMASPAATNLQASQEPAQSSSSLPSRTPSQTQEYTAEFGVNLEAINATGGAMDITPPQRALSHAPAMSLESIHSVGGALDMESPASAETQSPGPPLSMMKLCEGNGEVAREAEGTMGPARAKLTDIVKTLLKNPSADQEWASADLFFNLAKKREPTVESMLASIDSRQNGVIACMDDLMDKAKYLSQNKSTLKAKNESGARKLASIEWMELEIDFVQDLNKVLGSVFGKAAALSQRTNILKLPESSKQAKERSVSKSIEREITGLQECIRQEQEDVRLAGASEAPFSVLKCQATFGISGFRLDKFTGDALQLSFEHVVHGIESTFVFDLKTESVTASRRTVADSVQQPIPTNHIAARFHQYFLEQLVSGSIPLLQELQLAELQDSILTLSRWLGRIDLATCGLYLAANAGTASIVVEMPLVRLELPGGTSIQLDFAEAEDFMPSGLMTCKQGGTSESFSMPSKVTYHNVFQKIVEGFAS